MSAIPMNPAGDRTRTVVLHIGLAKTGTTYMQRRFVQNREWLESRGVWYPVVGQEYLYGHHNLGFYLQGQGLLDADWSGSTLDGVLASMLDSACPRVLVSCEGFSDFAPATCRRLRDALRPHAVEVVVYVRRRSGLCVSRWQEEVKHGSTRTFSEFLSRQLIRAGSALHIESPIVCAREAFGAGAVRVVVMDNLREAGQDLFEFFLQEVLGLDPEGVEPPPRSTSNESLSEALIETLRILNCLHGADAPCPRASLSNRARRFLRKDPAGAALLSEVEALYAAGAEELDLIGLDREWLWCDRAILDACGPLVLNPAGERELFADAPARRIRVLEPHLLHAGIPLSRFAAVHREIAAELQAGD